MKRTRQFPAALQGDSAVRGLVLVTAVVIIGIIFWRLQFSTTAICCGDFDGYYHIKWSRMLWESLRGGIFPPPFNWLPLTTLDPRHFVDHHLLFHGFQIPFTWFTDLRLAAKISAIIFATAAVLSCFWLLVHYRIRYSLIWLLALLACSAPFLYRMSMSKAPPFAIVYLVVGIWLLFKQKYWPLLPLTFIFALTYDMFVLLILAAGIWTVVIAWTERRLEWRPMVFVLAGATAGLVINPYFPRNLQLLYQHVRIKITPSDFSTNVGKEWYPYDTWEFLGNSLVACAAMLAGYIAFDPSDRKRAHHSLFFLLFASALMLMTARWKRIAEYWPPFAVMFAAFSLQPWLLGARSSLTQLSSDVLDELQPFLDLAEPPPKERDAKELLQTVALAIVAVVLATVLFFNLRATIHDIAASEPHQYYQRGAQWMQANVPAGQLIFNTDWDDFPRLFFYDPSHTYISGLDPTYLYDRDPARSKLYDRITLGEEEDPGPLIRDRFGARYVFTDNLHQDFFDNARHSGWFEIVYEDNECTILHILDQKVEAEPEAEPEQDEESPP
jgi:hypothetical protein